MEKGTYGYINNRKKVNLLKASIIFAIAFSIFVIGYILSKNSKQNVFTIIAVLLILPASRSLLAYIILFKYKTPDQSQYQKVLERLGKASGFYSDLAIASTEKTMFMDFLIINKTNIYAYTSQKNQNNQYVIDYFNRIMEARAFNFKFNLYTDFDLFLNSCDKFKNKEQENNDVESPEIKELKTTIKALLI